LPPENEAANIKVFLIFAAPVEAAFLFFFGNFFFSHYAHNRNLASLIILFCSTNPDSFLMYTQAQNTGAIEPNPSEFASLSMF